MVAVAIGGAAVVGLAGSAMSSSAQKSAANQASASDQAATQAQLDMFNRSEADLQPYKDAGQQNLGLMNNFYQTSADQLGQAYNEAHDHIPQAMTEANLINTPGYAFNLAQGQKAIQNSAAAKGLGISGAALKGAANYATGLADNTYQNQFANQQTIYGDYVNQANLKGNQLNQIYGQISAPVNLGEDAAARSGNNAIQTGQGMANTITAGGAAQAAGTVGSANALANGLNNVGGAGIGYMAMQNALNNNGGGGYIDSGTF